MTSQGSPHTRFRRALESGNPLIARAAAHELAEISLPDALSLLLLIRDREQANYPRLAIRWHRRLTDSARRMSLEESNLALAALLAMASGVPEPGARTMIDLLELHQLDASADVLERWLAARGD